MNRTAVLYGLWAALCMAIAMLAFFAIADLGAADAFKGSMFDGPAPNCRRLNWRFKPRSKVPTVSGNKSYNPNAGYTPTAGGDYWWYVSYSGDGNNNSATSTCGTGMTLGTWVMQ